MSDTTVWIIGLAFFAPLHYLGPTLAVFLTGAEAPSERATLLRRIVIDCSLSMLLAFALAVWLARVSLHAATLIRHSAASGWETVNAPRMSPS
jgi:hypothetical protein